MKNSWLQIFGWYGVGAILLAYALSVFNVIEPESRPYIFLNLTGSIAIALEAWSKRDVQPTVLNIIWAIIAIIGLIRLWL